MKKGSKVKVVKEQEDRHGWMINNNYYLGYRTYKSGFSRVTLTVGNIYEVLKVRGVKGPSSGFIEVKGGDGKSVFVLKEDVIEVK